MYKMELIHYQSNALWKQNLCLSRVACACNPRIHETEAGWSRVKTLGHKSSSSPLFWPSWDPVLKKKLNTRIKENIYRQKVLLWNCDAMHFSFTQGFCLDMICMAMIKQWALTSHLDLHIFDFLLINWQSQVHDHRSRAFVIWESVC